MSSFIQRRLKLFEQIKRKRMPVYGMSPKPIQVSVVANDAVVKVDKATEVSSAFEVLGSTASQFNFAEIKYLDCIRGEGQIFNPD